MTLVGGGRAVVIGGDAAGMSAATHVRRSVPDAQVTVFERGPYASYSMCGIPHLVGGQIAHARDLIVREPEWFAEQGVTLRRRVEAIGIDPRAQRVTVRDLDAGEVRDEPYDVLLHATGAHPRQLPVPGAEQYAVVVHTLDEGEHLRAHLDASPHIRSVTVIGAGYIGLELAEAAVRRGLKAVLLDSADQVMRSLDPDMAAHVESALGGIGVEVRLGQSVTAVEGADDRCRAVRTEDGVIDADVVVVAVGAAPNVAIAAAAGCELGETGALRVDDRMRTTVDRIWAAGDCVESRHVLTGRGVNVQLGTHANKQGKVAGVDLAAALSGGLAARGDARFPGVVGTAVTRVCDLEIARTGLNERQAREAGMDYATVSFEGSARAHYMPDPGHVRVKMLAEAGTGRLLGAQMVGTGNVGKRIDVAATWCQLGVAVQDAQMLDLSYAPPFGGPWDLLQVGARKLVRELGLSPAL